MKFYGDVMNYFLTFLLFIFPILTQAASGIELTCITDFPTTSFIVKQADDGFLYARVIQHNSSKYMPIFNGIVTPNDISYLATKAERMQKMADDMTFRWSIKSCKKHDDMRFECFGASDSKEYNGLKITLFSLHTARIQHDNIAGKYEEYAVSMSFRIGENKQFDNIEMVYPSEACTPKASNKILK